jgi:hypothetical protein
MLIELAASAELFHTANGTAFADLMIDGHRKPGRFAASGSGRGCGAVTTKRLAELHRQRSSGRPSIRSKLRLNSMRPADRSTCASPSRTVASIWIWPTSVGAR